MVSLSSVSLEVPGGLAAFDNILLAGACGLDHLVVSAAAAVDEAVTEVDCGVVDNLGLAIGEQVGVAAVRGNEAFGHGKLLRK